MASIATFCNSNAVSAVQIEEITAGLVVHLDPAILRSIPGCATNASIEGDVDRSVRGNHYFLILDVDEVDGAALAVPLFSNISAGRIGLNETLKRGPARAWIGRPSSFSPWQHWWIPLNHIVLASSVDDTSVGARRTYAKGNLEALQSVIDWKDKNRCEWRGV